MFKHVLLSIIYLTIVSAYPTSAEDIPPLSEKLTREGFVAQLNKEFRVWGGSGLGQVVKLRLIKVEDLQLSEQIANFTVIFRGPNDYILSKEVYKFAHPDTGELRLFIEPAGSDEQAQLYHVNLNLLR